MKETEQKDILQSLFSFFFGWIQKSDAVSIMVLSKSDGMLINMKEAKFRDGNDRLSGLDFCYSGKMICLGCSMVNDELPYSRFVTFFEAFRLQKIQHFFRLCKKLGV